MRCCFEGRDPNNTGTKMLFAIRLEGHEDIQIDFIKSIPSFFREMPLLRLLSWWLNGRMCLDMACYGWKLMVFLSDVCTDCFGPHPN